MVRRGVSPASTAMSTIPIPDLLTPAPQQLERGAQPLSASPVVQPSARAALEAYKNKDPSKIIVRFKSIGNAPIMKDNYFKITASNKFQAVIVFLRSRLGMKTEPLFTYINSSFSPAPDDTVANLFKCFGTEGHLIVNYSTIQAWG